MNCKLNLEYLPWDSKQLEISCGLLDIRDVLDNECKGELIKAEINNLLKENSNIKFVTIKLPSLSLSLLHHLVRKGADLIDTELTFGFFGNKELTPLVQKDISFKFLKKTESKYFVDLADEMLSSRFYIDERIGYSKANRLWRESIKNHCEGFADEVLVAYFKEKLCGIIAIRIKGKRDINLHIVGVLKEWQRMRVASMMLKQVVNKYKTNSNIYVETQLNNLSAQKVYQLNGFILHHFSYILHLWR